MKPFPAYVLVPADTTDVQVTVDGLLATYDKALQVAEYDGKCPCLYAHVEAKADDLAKNRVRDSDQAGLSAFERVTGTASASQEAQQAAIQEALNTAVPDPNCKDCGGSGTVKTTANPNGKFAHWEIDGSSSSNVLAHCLTEVVDNPNIIPVKLINLQEIPLPWAIVTPDGKWHGAGEPYWFGSSRVDDPDWENTVRKILAQHADATLVVVECQS